MGPLELASHMKSKPLEQYHDLLHCIEEFYVHEESNLKKNIDPN